VLVEYRVGREVMPQLFALGRMLQGRGLVARARGNAPRQRSGQDRTDVCPDMRVQEARRRAEPLRMVVTHELRADVVVERDELAPPVDSHRRRRMKADAERRAQAGGPVRYRAEWRVGPVALAYERCDFTVAQPAKRFVLLPRVHGSRSWSDILVE